MGAAGGPVSTSPLPPERYSPARVAWGPAWNRFPGLAGVGKLRPELERWAVKELGWEDRGMLDRKGMQVCSPGGRCSGRPEGVISGSLGACCSLPSSCPRGKGCLPAAWTCCACSAGEAPRAREAVSMAASAADMPPAEPAAAWRQAATEAG